MSPVVGIQVEKSRGNPYEKYRGVPKGGVMKGCDKKDVIKGTCMYSYQGCKNPVFYNKYIIICFILIYIILYFIMTINFVLFYAK